VLAFWPCLGVNPCRGEGGKSAVFFLSKQHAVCFLSQFFNTNWGPWLTLVTIKYTNRLVNRFGEVCVYSERVKDGQKHHSTATLVGWRQLQRGGKQISNANLSMMADWLAIIQMIMTQLRESAIKSPPPK